MSGIFWIAFLILATCVVMWSYFTAQRLNSLHIRTDAALAQLQAALDRRAAVVAALQPKMATVAARAEGTSLKPGQLEKRMGVERELNAQLQRERSKAPSGLSPLLVEADTRVKLALRFYNEAVADTRALRLRPAVRALRLGGTAPLPEYCDYPFMVV
ncbi:MAG: hypothetical protein SOW59_07595 [Corynebacterium sp.]|nr:hypothetical protein [Corynebacterium sp.]